MTGVRGSLARTRSDALAEAVSAESCHIVLETSPPDYVKKISRYLESSVGPSGQDKVSNEPAEAESDSGDSLFITQKPVPEAVRSARPRYYSSRSDPISPRGLEESSDDTSSSTFYGEGKTDTKRRRKKHRLPKFSFPFLQERKWKPRSSLLAVQQNTRLHNYAMGGFFKCVTELWQDQGGDHLESTVDTDGDYISPLSEEDRGEEEDIRVVERKRFVAPAKAKSRQTWCNQLKRPRRRKPGNARQESSRVCRWKATLCKIPAKASISRVTVLSTDAENSDDGESSCRVLVEKERNGEHITSDGNLLAQTPKTNRPLTRRNAKILFQGKAAAEELCNDRDAPVCEPLNALQRSPRQYTQNGRGASTTVTEPQTDDLSQTGEAAGEAESQNVLHILPDLISDTNNDRVCNETRVRKRNKTKKDKGDPESVDEEQGQSQEERLHAATPVNVRVDETPSPSKDNSAKLPASQARDELELNDKNEMENSRDENILSPRERDSPDSKRKKKKRKKNKSAAENVDGILESGVSMEESVFSGSCNMENGGRKKKKKKKKRNVEEDVEQLQSSAVVQPLIDDAEIQKKKKRRKKEETIVVTQECEEEEASNRTLDLPQRSTGQLEEPGKCLGNTAASLETFESSCVTRKKHKRKQQASSYEVTQDGEEGVSVSNDAVTSAKGTELSLKKKKKKKITEGVAISHTPEENENVDNTWGKGEGLEDQNAELVTKKKKKKKRKSEISSRNISEDNVAQSDDSVSAREKEKKRAASFLDADAEENNAQTHGEHSSPSQSVDGHGRAAEKPGVSAGEFETGSAEYVESNGGVGKRKKKRKMPVAADSVEKGNGQEFEEPDRTCPSALPETIDTGVKRKKKRMGNESELVTAMEGLESAADVGRSPTDEAAVLEKKKKKKCKEEPCHMVQESPLRKKGKQLSLPLVAMGKHDRSVDLSHDGSTSDHVTKEMLDLAERASPSSGTPRNQPVNDRREKKKKTKVRSAGNVLLEGQLTKSAGLEPPEDKKKEKRERTKQSADPSIMSSSPMLSETSLSKSQMSSSDRIMKMKHKRRLHNPSEDFLTDY